MSWLGKLAEEATFRAAADDDFVSEDSVHRATLPRTDFGYDRSVHGGLESNVVMSPVNWLTRNFTEAELAAQSRVDGKWEPIPEHPLVERVTRPNPFYGGNLLWTATLTSVLLDGNGYWMKVRSRLREVVQLWYLPHFLVTPKFPRDGSEFISHYEFRPRFGGELIELDVEDVVHFRHGLDPNNVRMGLSPVKPILREVFTDEEAANFSASILRNMGVPGGIIAPKDASQAPSREEIQEMKEYMKSGFTGDRRGEWLVLGKPTETSQFGFDPGQLMLHNLRDIAEERVCAALGIPAAVVGFGAGLQQTKVGATMRELVRLARVNAVEPTQNSTARQLTRQLMPDFEPEPTQVRAVFDNRNVAMFQEDLSDVAKRASLLFREGVISRDEARDMVNMAPSGDDEFRDAGENGGRRNDDPLRIDALAGRMR